MSPTATAFVVTTVVRATADVPYFTRTVQVFGVPDACPAETTSPEIFAQAASASAAMFAMIGMSSSSTAFSFSFT